MMMTMKNLMQKTLIVVFLVNSIALTARNIYVSPVGNDSHDGSIEHPFYSFERAVVEARKFVGKEPVTVWFSEGNYYLQKTIEMGSEFSGTAKNPLVFSAMPGARVNLKGARLLGHLDWKPFKEGVYVTEVPEGLDFDQLYVNDIRQTRARFPNHDDQNPIRGGNGYLQVTDGSNQRYDEWFSFNPETFSSRQWANPETGIVHAFQSHNWGNMQYRIKNIDRTDNKVILGEGGWQLQRKYGVGGKERKASWYFIDNVFEELDATGEWFLDETTNLLYYYPVPGVNLTNAKVEVPVIQDLIQLKGTSNSPVKHVQFKGFRFTQSRYTFMEAYEPVARGDWAIHRGGALFLEGTENCMIDDCRFNSLGGNGVFMSGYNRDNTVSGCEFVHIAESAVCFVGDPSAVRFYQTWDDQEILGKDWDDMRKNMDLEPGPKGPDYPKNCTVENSIMHDFGEVGKQVAGVYISMSHKIIVSHNTVYNCPRAGICINDGTWGGHIIEFCDIWETVRETGEHGPFNSWGRERQWKGSRGTDEHFIKEWAKLDAIDPVVLRNNRIANYRRSISAGNWTIDLDDGSSYFEIYNNLNLGSTIKLRDGMARKVYNNITVSPVPLGWHVWPKESEDEIYQNIFVISGAIPGKDVATDNFIRPIALPTDTKWSEHYDHNLYWNMNDPDTVFMYQNTTMDQWVAQGYDEHSVLAAPMFVDPLHGNYQVEESSKALTLGFRNFSMDEFGHQMTRVIPFGGEFVSEVSVTIKPDKRAESGSIIYYTLDGSDPNIYSLKYKGSLILKNSTQIKARTFNADHVPVGIGTEASFRKVKELNHPSWLDTLLEGGYENETENKPVVSALEKEVFGALLVNIADDPDLIDGTGGYNYGCYIKTLSEDKSNIWRKARLDTDWVIQKINGQKVQNIAELETLQNFKGETIIVTGVRDYKAKKFKCNLK